MSELLQAFVGNPMTTFIGKKVEAATRLELENDDWALNLEICDIINESDNDAKDAVRAIKKRLQQIEHDSNFTITNRTLTVLETCVSNCSHRFHALVMTKDFIQDLVKLIGPKNNPPIDLQERVLRLIERWAKAFIGQPDLNGVVSVYNDLKAKGVTFPAEDPNCPNVPIQTPQRSVPPRQPSPSMRQALPQTAPAMLQTRDQPAGQVVLEGEGYSKISRDLGVVQSSIEMFNEILALIEVKNLDSDWNLAADLNATCRQMKERIVDLIERVANEDLTVELLQLNDELNNIFIKYDRQLKNRSKSAASNERESAERAVMQPTISKPPTIQNDLSLIDFNAGDEAEPSIQPTSPSGLVRDSIETGLKNMNLKDKTVAPKSTTGLPAEVSSVREQDFAEIENWLSTDSGRDMASVAGDLPSVEPTSLTSPDFDKFIASRAMAGSSQGTSDNLTANTSKQSKLEPSS